jgi:hypothetical protein
MEIDLSLLQTIVTYCCKPGLIGRLSAREIFGEATTIIKKSCHDTAEQETDEQAGYGDRNPTGAATHEILLRRGRP